MPIPSTLETKDHNLGIVYKAEKASKGAGERGEGKGRVGEKGMDIHSSPQTERRGRKARIERIWIIILVLQMILPVKLRKQAEENGCPVFLLLGGVGRDRERVCSGL